jgi:predicted anti-sigma-YlaC factor YlaD
MSSLPASECRKVREAVSARLDGELAELETGLDQIELHLRDCSACAEFSSDVEAITQALRTAALESPYCDVVLLHRRRRLSINAGSAAAAAIASLVIVSSYPIVQALRSGSIPAADRPSLQRYIAAPDQRVELLQFHQDSPALRLGPIVIF